MGRKRAAIQRQNGQRVCGDTYSAASAIASVLADPRADSTDTPAAVMPKCVQLLNLLTADVILSHYIAQGYPTLIHRLLPHGAAIRNATSGECVEDDAPLSSMSQLPALLLCALLIRCGAPMSDVSPAVEKHADALVFLAGHANAAVASVALIILRTAVSESEHAGAVAAHLLEDESVLWASMQALQRTSEADDESVSGDVPATHLPLASIVHLVRLCVAAVTASTECPSAPRIMQWIESLPLSTDGCGTSEAQQSLEDAVLLLAATLCIKDSDTIEDVETMMARMPFVDASVKQMSEESVPLSSRDIAVRLYLHATQRTDSLVSLYQCVHELRERDFDASRRLASVERLGSLLTALATDCGRAYATAVLHYMPGALAALYGAACDVEVSTSTAACRLLASLLRTSAAGTPDVDAADGPLCAFFQNELAEALVRLGCIVTLEDALSDYNDDVLTAALALTAGLLAQHAQSRGAVLSSLCLQRVTQLFHAVAEKEDVQAYLAEPAHRLQFVHAFDVLLLLTTDELAVLPQELVGDVSTVTTFCRDDLDTMAKGLDVLARLAEAHPYAATMIVDYDFVTEQLQSPDEPEGAELCLVNGTLNIMTAMAARLPSTVSLEWIELLLLCMNRLQVWQASSASKLAMWRCLRETLLVSEDSREYIFEDEELSTWVVAALKEEVDARVVAEIMHVLLYIPNPLSGLVEAILEGGVVKHCAEGCFHVGDQAADVGTIQRILLDCVALVTSRADDTRASPLLLQCLLSIVTCAARWPMFVPQLLTPLQDCFIATWESIVTPVVDYVRATLHLKDAADVEERVVPIDDDAPESPDDVAAVVLLDALGAAATVSINTCSPNLRRACTTLAVDLVTGTQPIPVKARLAGLFLLLQALTAPDSPELAVSLLDSTFFEAVQQFGVTQSADLVEGAEVTPPLPSGPLALENQIREALYQTTGRLVQALPYERQQHLEQETAFTTFLTSRALPEVSKSSACCDLLMHVLSNEHVRKLFSESKPDTYRAALDAIEEQRGSGPLQFVLATYKSELV